MYMSATTERVLFMKNNMKKIGLPKRLGAFALALLMVVGLLPARIYAAEDPTNVVGTVTTVADPDTVSRPVDIYGNNTQNAGKVTVGKSVSDGSVTLDYGNTNHTFAPEADNFIVTISQTAQVMGLASESQVPVDVVFVLDTSNSMSGGRATSMVDATNKAIASLMASNPNNRVGVVAFSSYESGYYSTPSAEQLSALAHYDDVDGNNDGDLNDRYDTPAASQHLTWDDGYIVGRGTNAGSRDGVGGGTNIHAGVALGAQMLTNATTTVEIDGKTVTRMPFLVVLSDGAPTFSSSSTNWYAPSMTEQQGPGSSFYAGNSFLAVATAAYYKGVITEHYYPNNASEDNRCYIYTIGVGLSDLTGNEGALAQMTMDPSTYFQPGSTNDYYNSNGNNDFYSYWNQYTSVPYNGFTVQINNGSNFRITRNSINATSNYINGVNAAGKKMYEGGLTYNDDYFSANQTADIEAAFDKAIMEIQQKAISVPTRVDEAYGADFSGYVTFTDPIGEYMEVKQMYGVLANGNWYRGKTFAQYLQDWDNAPAEFKELFIQVLQKRCMLTGATVDAEAFIRQASASKNQAYYNSDADFDNSIVWWGSSFTAAGEEDEQVQYLGFADNDTLEYITDPETVIPADADYVCRSYFYYGTAGNTVINPNHEYLYFVVQVRRSLTAPYQQTVTVSAPASLLSAEQVLITEKIDSQGNTTYTAAVTEAEPARVVYEVGLRSDINAYNVEQILAEDPAYLGEQAEFNDQMVNTNFDAATGTYTFYTNDWDRTEPEDSHHRALAKATFDAAVDNAFYAYQEDTVIYVKDGNNYVPYTGTAKPVGADYYYAREVYDWSNADPNADGTYNADQYTVYIPVDLPDVDAIKASGDGWVIAKGTYKASSLTGGENVAKDPNNTQTSGVVSHPHRTESESNSHYTVCLGNNGKLTLKSEKTKSVNLTKADNTVITDADGKVVMVGDTLTYELKVINGESTTADALVTDAIPVGTEYVAGSASDGGSYDETTGIITWNLTGLAAGETVTVSFQVVVTVDALSGENTVATIDNTASVKLTNGFAYETNTTHNPPEGKKVVDTSGNLITGSVQVPDVLVYRIRYYNDTDAVSTVTVQDIIPSGTSYVAGSASHNGVYNADEQNITWIIENVQPGASGVVSFRVNVNASAIEYIENDATIKIGDNDPRQTNDTQVTVKSGDLILSKEVLDNGYPNALTQEFTLTITEIGLGMNGTYAMTRNGQAVAQGVTFTKGVATVTIKNGDSLRISGIPAGAILTVAENTKSGFSPVYHVNGAAQAITTEGRVTIVDGDTPVSVKVVNTYAPAATTFQLSGTKKLETTAELTDTVFGFTVYGCDKNGNILTGADASLLTGEVTVSSGKKEAAILFAPQIFTEAGTYYYLIGEIDGGLTGVDYAANQYMLTVVVTDNGSGALQASATLKQRTASDAAFGADAAYTDTGVTFTNIYKPLETQLTLEAAKELTGRNLKDGEFSFVVKQGDTVVSTGINDADGKVAFRPITYTEAGTYTYTITEVNGGLKGVEYDTTSYTVTVEVVDDKGQLEATASYSAPAKFVNKYTPDGITVTLNADKTLDNRSGHADRKLQAGEFRFVVKDESGEVVSSGTNAANGSIAFTPIGYTAADAGKTYTYTVSEVIPDLAADPYMDYDEKVFTVTVSVSYDADMGTLSAKVTYPEGGIGFTNVQHPDSITVTPQGTKTTTVTSGSQAQIPEGATFSFTVINATTGNEAGAGVGNANGEFLLSTLNYSQPGTYRYWLRETHAGLETHGITYDDTIYLMEIVVTLTDGKLAATTNYYALKNGGNPDNIADYTVKLSDLPAFENHYDAKGQISLTAEKVLQNNTLREGDFAFRLVRQDNQHEITGVAAADGTIRFATLYYDLSEFGSETTKTIHYQMSEVIPENAKLPGVTYDTSVRDVYITITHMDDGTISAMVTDAQGNALTGLEPTDTGVTFTNTYAPKEGTTVTIEASKTLTGRALKDGEFTFELYHVSKDGVENLVDVATNDADGNVRFTRVYPANVLDGNDSADVTYYIREANNNLGGVTYDPAKFNVTVTITDNKDGTLSAAVRYDGLAAGKTPEFKNTYSADGTQYTPVAFKTLENRVLADNEFSFVVKQGDTVVSTGWSKADGSVAFSPIGYEKPGTYQYTVSEVKGNLTGVAYTDIVYYLQVTVVDNQDGTMTATGVYYSDSACTKVVSQAAFTNIYTPQNASVQLAATKTLTGRDMTQGEFSFVVKQGDTVVATGGNAAAKDGESAAVTFSAIGYKLSDLAGTDSKEFIYTITELATTQGGITFDDTVYYAKVTLTNNRLTGVLEASVKYYSDAACTQEITAAAFANRYAPAPVTLDLTATKTLINKTLEAGEFTFTLTDVSGKTAPITAVNDAQGNVAFQTLTFTTPGTYTFTISEAVTDASKADRYTMDNAFTVVITVTDNQKGQLVATATYHENAADGTYDANLNLGGVAFINRYTAPGLVIPLDAQIGATKSVNTPAGITYSPEGFRFAVMDVSGNIIKGLDANGNAVDMIGVSDADGKISFPSFTFSQAGEYHYWIQEQDSDNGGITEDSRTWEVHILVRYDAATGLLYVNDADVQTYLVGGTVSKPAFVNTYNPAPTSLNLAASKVLEGRELKDREFLFYLMEGDRIAAQAYNNAQGTVRFELNYTAIGTHTYTIQEYVPEIGLGGVTYDTQKYATITVDVRDNGQGQLVAYIGDKALNDGATVTSSVTVRNTYAAAETSATIQAGKTLLGGKPLAPEAYTFILTNAQNAEDVYTATNDASGGVQFKVTYTKAGTYTYHLTEQKGTDPGITYDETVHTVTVTVTDDGKGQLHAYVHYTNDLVPTFTNTYKAAPVTAEIKAHKTLQGDKPLAAEVYTFELEAEDGTVITANNAANGDVVFSQTYDAAGVYTYILRERKGEELGTTYDERTFNVTVTVSDNYNGNLVAEVVYEGVEDGKVPGFVNSYKGAEVPVKISAQKLLEGRSLKGNDFTFLLTNQADATDVLTAKNDADGNIAFSITFENAGVYTYTLTEQAGSDDNITYDSTPYTVTITVTDDLEGYLRAQVVYGTTDGTAPSFQNVYKPDPVAVELAVNKTLTGRDMKKNEFRFQVLDSKGNVLATAWNAADGKVSFPAINLELAGTYTFTVIEVKGSDRTITYDTARYTIKVTVTNTDGVLSAVVTYPEGGITFKNAYKDPDPTTPPTADGSPVVLMLALMMFSGAGIAVMEASRKRRTAKR